MNRLTDIFAVGKYVYDVMVRYQNLTWKPKLFQAPWARVPLGPGPGTMYPLNPPLVGSANSLGNKTILRKKFVKYCEKTKYSRSNRLVKLLGSAILATAVAGSKQSLHYRSYQCNESVESCDLSCHCFCIELMNQNRLIEGKIIITPIMLKRFYILLDL